MICKLFGHKWIRTSFYMLCDGWFRQFVCKRCKKDTYVEFEGPTEEEFERQMG